MCVITSTDRLSRCLTTAICPLEAAAWRGVYPLLSLQLTSAPCSTSRRTTSKWPAEGRMEQSTPTPNVFVNNAFPFYFFSSSRQPDWISWLDLQQNRVHYFLNHSCYISKLGLVVYKMSKWLFRPSRLTHVCRPVKSTAVLLVKGINIGPLRQQQTDHLSSKGTGETSKKRKKIRNGKMVGKKEWLC